MKNVVVIPNAAKDPELAVTSALVSKLCDMGVNVHIKDCYNVRGAISYSDLPSAAELIMVVGGDGSVIDASRLAVERDIPLVGVNLGRVGYLSEIDPCALDVLDALKSGSYFITEKMLLSVSTDGWEGYSYAVNDVVISHSDCIGISTFRLQDSVGNSLSYRADGIILATPQGSTAYSLSSGGPVVAHDVDSILATPVCTHSFFDRSVLFNSKEVLVVTNTGEGNLNICIDGRVSTVLTPGAACNVRRADVTLKMLSFSKNSMFTGLFKKMSILEGFK